MPRNQFKPTKWAYFSQTGLVTKQWCEDACLFPASLSFASKNGCCNTATKSLIYLLSQTLGCKNRQHGMQNTRIVLIQSTWTGLASATILYQRMLNFISLRLHVTSRSMFTPALFTQGGFKKRNTFSSWFFLFVLGPLYQKINRYMWTIVIKCLQ